MPYAQVERMNRITKENEVLRNAQRLIHKPISQRYKKIGRIENQSYSIYNQSVLVYPDQVKKKYSALYFR